MGTVYDYAFDEGLEGLGHILHEINRRGYRVIAVTQYEDTYTVVFQRPLDGGFSRY